MLFREAFVGNRTTVAVVPLPGRRPFFEASECQTPDEVTPWRKRRGPLPLIQNPTYPPVRVPDFRPAAPSASIPRWPNHSQLEGPAPRWYRARTRKLTPEQDSVIRAVGATRSLSSLAADFGASHETIRLTLRRLPQQSRSSRRGTRGMILCQGQ